MCEYTYNISSDIGNDLNRESLIKAILFCLRIKKLEK